MVQKPVQLMMSLYNDTKSDSVTLSKDKIVFMTDKDEILKSYEQNTSRIIKV